LLVQRMQTRSVQQGKMFSELGVLRAELADARISLDQARLLVMYTAAAMDSVGHHKARFLISQTKVAIPETVLKILDHAMQVHGGVGLSHQFPLSSWYARTRTVRFMDGPDAVHKEVIAKQELLKSRSKL